MLCFCLVHILDLLQCSCMIVNSHFIVEAVSLMLACIVTCFICSCTPMCTVLACSVLYFCVDLPGLDLFECIIFVCAFSDLSYIILVCTKLGLASILLVFPCMCFLLP